MRSKKSIKINIRDIIYILIFIPYFKPDNLVVSPIISNIFSIWRILSCMYIIYKYINKKNISKITLIISLYEVILLINSLIRYGLDCDINNLCIQVFSVISLVMFAEMGIEKDGIDFLEAVWKYGWFMSTLTIMTMFIYYPIGMKNYETKINIENFYLMGIDNAAYFGIFVINVLGIYIMFVKEKNKVSVTFLYIITLISHFYTFSTTAMMVHLMLGIYVISIKKIKKKFNYFFLFMLNVLFSFFLIVLRIDQVFLKLLFRLGKGSNLNGRAEIWSKAIKYIGKSLIFGYGYENSHKFFEKFYMDHLHNIFLDTFYVNGLIGIFILFLIFFLIGKKIMDNNSIMISNLLTGAIVLFLFLAQFDYYNTRYMIFFLYIVSYYGEKIDSRVQRMRKIE